VSSSPRLLGFPVGADDLDLFRRCPRAAKSFIRTLGLGETVPLAPSFRFKPIPRGFEVFMMDLREANRGRRGNPRFEILDDAGWEPLLDECVALCCEALSFDPFGQISRPVFLGFDTRTAKR
jgi:hypothetical protein